ncbi:MAG: phospholipid-binding protein [Treponema sp.]|nr:MAG: phospholipid-binding protein [Treponema sp.]
MAIITISRKIASLGDETAKELANNLNYKFITRKMIEEDLIKRGISEETLKQYDEKKPGFWASLSRNRDKYFDYLRETVYEYGENTNCIFIGRGGFAILKDVPGCYSVRLVSPDNVRLKRLMTEFNWSEQQAKKLILESDENREGFHKCFFNVVNEDPTFYDMVLNTGAITAQTAAEIIRSGFEKTIGIESEEASHKYIANRLLGQRIVNKIAFEEKLQIFFLDAEVCNDKIILHGIIEESNLVDKAVEIAKELSNGKTVVSEINYVNNYRANSKNMSIQP